MNTSYTRSSAVKLSEKASLGGADPWNNQPNALEEATAINTFKDKCGSLNIT